MALEDALAANTAAIVALTKQLAGTSSLTPAGGKTPAGTTAAGKAGKTGAAGTKPKHTFEQVSASVMEVKNEIDKDTARECIEGVAGVGKKLADIASMPQHFDSIVAACKEAMEAADQAAPADDDDDV